MTDEGTGITRVTLRHPRYTRDRLRQTADRLRALVYPETRLPDVLRISPRVDRISVEEAQELEFEPVELGRQLGPLWATYWFQIEATAPRQWAGRRVDLLWVTGSESTLWIDGRSVQGLNTGSQGERPDAVLAESAAPGQRFDLLVEVACNGKFGSLPRPHPALEPVVLDRCEIALFDEEAWSLWLEFSMLRELEAEHERGLDPAWAGRLLSELNRFCNVWDAGDRSTWGPAREILAGLLANRNGTWAHELSAIGHAHLDTAWLWPLAETYRKCVRTFSSQARYMDMYPEFRFACSQAQQYAWVKARNPDLYARIRERVERGQWIPVGGTWVEPDCNLPSGEALVRQFLLGQRFFERELGRRCREFWQPDVFGYNGQLPQLMRGAGIARFLTQKLSWNRFNPPPHHTFRWQGIDGSEVVAHFPPADTYNAEASVADLARNARNFKDHARSRESLMLFGWGDGGGGPTPRMIETLLRARDLQGLPRTAMRTSDEFFERLEAENADLPTIVGELYFEYHRGTYTSQARTKRANRRSEQLLHDVEFLAAAAHKLNGAPYPAVEIEGLWQRLCLNAFHDILPGSSIGLVYEDAERDYAWILSEGERLKAAALDVLSSGDGPTPVNTIAADRSEIVEAPGGELSWVECPGYGAGRIGSAPDSVTATEDGERIVLENGALRATLLRGGELLSLIEKESGREALSEAGNRLELYDDRPTAFDAWDIDPFHLETGTVCAPADSVSLTRPGPLRAEVVFDRRIGAASSLRQTVRLDAGARRLEFFNEIDWHEEHRLLKVAFPTVVRSESATYEMQFGVVERPTHYSTSHDLARFEVPGTSIRRSHRARLRGCAPLRGDVRLVDLRRHDAHVVAPRTNFAGSRGRSRRALDFLCDHAALWRLAGGGRRRRGAPLQRSGGLGPGRSRGRVVDRSGRCEPRPRHRQARGGLRRSRASPLRVTRRERECQGSARVPVRGRAVLQPARGRSRPSARRGRGDRGTVSPVRDREPEGRLMDPDEIARSATNYQVGSRLLFENGAVRVWDITLEPGERLPFHCHRTSYFYRCEAAGSSRVGALDGSGAIYDSPLDEVVFHDIPAGETMIHDLTNVGDTVLRFTTVELVADSAQ